MPTISGHHAQWAFQLSPQTSSLCSSTTRGPSLPISPASSAAATPPIQAVLELQREPAILQNYFLAALYSQHQDTAIFGETGLHHTGIEHDFVRKSAREKRVGLLATVFLMELQGHSSRAQLG